MPDISRFYGIVILMYADGIRPPIFMRGMRANLFKSALTRFGFWKVD